MKRLIVRASKSPMNEKRWCLDLECGHEVWVNGKPKGKKAECETCRIFEEKRKKESARESEV